MCKLLYYAHSLALCTLYANGWYIHTRLHWASIMLCVWHRWFELSKNVPLIFDAYGAHTPAQRAPIDGSGSSLLLNRSRMSLTGGCTWILGPICCFGESSAAHPHRPPSSPSYSSLGQFFLYWADFLSSCRLLLYCCFLLLLSFCFSFVLPHSIHTEIHCWNIHR